MKRGFHAWAAGLIPLLTLPSLSACRAYDRGTYELLLDADAGTVDPASDVTETDAAMPDDAPDDAPADGSDDADVVMPCVGPAPTSYCDTAIALPARPVIDGVIECGMRLEVIPNTAFDASHGTLPGRFVASYGIAWHPDGLYVFVRVSGSRDDPALPTENAWCGDDIEIFADHDGVFTAPPAYDLRDTTQFVITAPQPGEAASTRAEIVTHGASQGPWRHTQWAVIRSGTNVDYEAFIEASDLDLAVPWVQATGDHVGFDLAISVGIGRDHDAGPCSHLAGQVVLRRVPTDAGCGHPACDVDAFCVPVLAP